MQNFKFILEPYKPGSANKHTCPSCGKTKCFVKYIDTDTGEYLADECGRCDHENSCGYHLTPKQYLYEHPEQKTNFSFTNPNAHGLQHISQIVTRPIHIIDEDYATLSYSNNSVFIDWLKQQVDDEDKLLRVTREYQIGATRDRAVIFWQRDYYQRIRTGKIMHYNSNGHRTGNPDWVHSRLIKEAKLPAEWFLTQCLYGEHLLPFYPYKTVCIVESEKTALLFAALIPQYIWVATGGCKQLKTDTLKVLAHRTVIVIPDSGQYDKWLEIMQKTTDIDYRMVRQLEQYPPNTDLADIIVNKGPSIAHP